MNLSPQRLVDLNPTKLVMFKAEMVIFLIAGPAHAAVIGESDIRRMASRGRSSAEVVERSGLTNIQVEGGNEHLLANLLAARALAYEQPMSYSHGESLFDCWRVRAKAGPGAETLTRRAMQLKRDKWPNRRDSAR